MNKLHVYKSLGVIESYIMFLNDKLDSTTSDYVMTHLDLLQKWVDKSEISLINEHYTGSPFFKDKDNPFELCKVSRGSHLFCLGKCDYCGKIVNETNQTT